MKDFTFAALCVVGLSLEIILLCTGSLSLPTLSLPVSNQNFFVKHLLA